MMRRAAHSDAMLLMVLSLLISSCSGSAPEQDKLVLTRDRIIEAFEEQTGDGLRQTSVSKDIREWADLPRMERLDPKVARQAERYGNFTIFVYAERDVRDRDMSATGPPDSRGIYWYEGIHDERGPDANKRYWAAEKRYGENVLLTWWPKSRNRVITEEWHRLDKILTSATR